MQVDDSMYHSLKVIVDASKFWLALAAVVLGGNKIFTWVKEIRTKDLKEVQNNLAELSSKIKDVSTKIDDQTTAVVSELKELRGDFRTFYISPTPQMLPARAKPAPRSRKKEAKVDVIECV